VKKRTDYLVRFSELKSDEETFEFLLEDSFFNTFESTDWESGMIVVVVTIRKRPDGITIDFTMQGDLSVVCDRCLDLLVLPVTVHQQLFVKYGSFYEELDDNIVVVAKEDNQIDLSGYFYDYLLLSIPVKKVHPSDENGISYCNSKMIEKLQEYIIDEEKDETDPRWDDLKKLMDKN
jgi:uncharacterized metal-binding protein YceD (DUF177 family)